MRDVAEAVPPGRHLSDGRAEADSDDDLCTLQAWLTTANETPTTSASDWQRTNPGIEYEDLSVDETHNREVFDLIQFIDEEDRDGLGVYLEYGFLDHREGKVRKGVAKRSTGATS